MEPRVSHIITTCNRPEKLASAVHSVLSDTYGNREIIIVDDCSTTPAASVLSEFDNLRLVSTSNRSGVGTARNLGIQTATGKYVTFLDDDDVSYADKTAVLVDVAEETDASFVFGRTIKKFITEPDRPAVPIPELDYSQSKDFSWVEPEEFLFRMPTHNNGILLRRDDLVAVGGYEQDVFYFDDWAGWLKLLAKGVKPVFLPHDVAEFRYTPHGLSGSVQGNGGLGHAIMGMYRRALSIFSDDSQRRDIILSVMKDIEGKSFLDYDEYVEYIAKNRDRFMKNRHRWFRAGTFPLRETVHDTMTVSADVIRREMIDPPENPPKHEVTIDRVGIVDQPLYLTVDDVAGPRSLYGTIDVGVNLPATFRGIHMSRIVSLVDTLSRNTWQHPLDFLRELQESVLAKQRGSKAYIDMVLHTPVALTLPESGREYTQHFDYRFGIEGDVFYSGVTVAHMTACPCVQCYADCLNGYGNDHVPPKITHSQRSLSTIKLWAKDITTLQIVDPLSFALRQLIVVTDMLRREDEFNVVYSAHMKPQFIEDCVRELGAEIKGHVLYPDYDKVTIQSRSLESIHSRDIAASLTMVPDRAERGDRHA